MAPIIECIDLGDPAVVTIPFTVGGVATTPGGATFVVRPPAGAGREPITYTYPGAQVTNPATGTLVLTVPAATIKPDAGLWSVKIESTGAAEAGESLLFFVRSDPA